jgi:hypothetical protein
LPVWASLPLLLPVTSAAPLAFHECHDGRSRPSGHTSLPFGSVGASTSNSTWPGGPALYSPQSECGDAARGLCRIAVWLDHLYRQKHHRLRTGRLPRDPPLPSQHAAAGSGAASEPIDGIAAVRAASLADCSASWAEGVRPLPAELVRADAVLSVASPHRASAPIRLARHRQRSQVSAAGCPGSMLRRPPLPSSCRRRPVPSLPAPGTSTSRVTSHGSEGVDGILVPDVGATRAPPGTK